MNTPHLPHSRTPTKRHFLFALVIVILLVLGLRSSRPENFTPSPAPMGNQYPDTIAAPLLVHFLLSPPVVLFN